MRGDLLRLGGVERGLLGGFLSGRRGRPGDRRRRDAHGRLLRRAPLWLAPLLSQPAVPSAAGLFVAGLGFGNLYPLGVSLATGAVPRVADLATSRITLIVGCATLTIPSALGIAADRFGIGNAYAIVAALLLAAVPLAVAVDRSTRKQ